MAKKLSTCVFWLTPHYFLPEASNTRAPKNIFRGVRILYFPHCGKKMEKTHELSH